MRLSPGGPPADPVEPPAAEPPCEVPPCALPPCALPPAELPPCALLPAELPPAPPSADDPPTSADAPAPADPELPCSDSGEEQAARSRAAGTRKKRCMTGSFRGCELRRARGGPARETPKSAAKTAHAPA